MITTISFEIAKLLKEKGFEQKTKSYTKDGKLVTVSLTIRRFNPEKIYYPAPTIAEVVMWLCEKHGIWISVDCDCYGILWYANLSVASEKNWDNIDLRHEIISASKKFPNEHNSPTEAYEAAIEYTLNNLI